MDPCRKPVIIHEDTQYPWHSTGFINAITTDFEVENAWLRIFPYLGHSDIPNDHAVALRTYIGRNGGFLWEKILKVGFLRQPVLPLVGL